MSDLRALAAAVQFTRNPGGWVQLADPEAFLVLADAVMEAGLSFEHLGRMMSSFIDYARWRMPNVLFLRGSETEDRRGRPMTDAEVVRALLDGTLQKRVRAPRKGRVLVLGVTENDALIELQRGFVSIVHAHA